MGMFKYLVALTSALVATCHADTLELQQSQDDSILALVDDVEELDTQLTNLAEKRAQIRIQSKAYQNTIADAIDKRRKMYNRGGMYYIRLDTKAIAVKRVAFYMKKTKQTSFKAPKVKQYIKWLTEREGKNMPKRLIPGYVHAATYMFDRASYKIYRNIIERINAQYNADLKKYEKTL